MPRPRHPVVGKALRIARSVGGDLTDIDPLTGLPRLKGVTTDNGAKGFDTTQKIKPPDPTVTDGGGSGISTTPTPGTFDPDNAINLGNVDLSGILGVGPAPSPAPTGQPDSPAPSPSPGPAPAPSAPAPSSPAPGPAPSSPESAAPAPAPAAPAPNDPQQTGIPDIPDYTSMGLPAAPSAPPPAGTPVEAGMSGIPGWAGGLPSSVPSSHPSEQNPTDNMFTDPAMFGIATSPTSVANNPSAGLTGVNVPGITDQQQSNQPVDTSWAGALVGPNNAGRDAYVQDIMNNAQDPVTTSLNNPMSNPNNDLQLSDIVNGINTANMTTFSQIDPNATMNMTTQNPDPTDRSNISEASFAPQGFQVNTDQPDRTSETMAEVGRGEVPGLTQMDPAVLGTPTPAIDPTDPMNQGISSNGIPFNSMDMNFSQIDPASIIDGTVDPTMGWDAMNGTMSTPGGYVDTGISASTAPVDAGMTPGVEGTPSTPGETGFGFPDGTTPAADPSESTPPDYGSFESSNPSEAAPTDAPSIDSTANDPGATPTDSTPSTPDESTSTPDAGVDSSSTPDAGVGTSTPGTDEGSSATPSTDSTDASDPTASDVSDTADAESAGVDSSSSSTSDTSDTADAEGAGMGDAAASEGDAAASGDSAAAGEGDSAAAGEGDSSSGDGASGDGSSGDGSSGGDSGGGDAGGGDSGGDSGGDAGGDSGGDGGDGGGGDGGGGDEHRGGFVSKHHGKTVRTALEKAKHHAKADKKQAVKAALRIARNRHARAH